MKKYTRSPINFFVHKIDNFTRDFKISSMPLQSLKKEKIALKNIEI